MFSGSDLRRTNETVKLSSIELQGFQQASCLNLFWTYELLSTYDCGSVPTKENKFIASRWNKSTTPSISFFRTFFEWNLNKFWNGTTITVEVFQFSFQIIQINIINFHLYLIKQSFTVDTSLVTQFWALRNCFTKGVSERFCDDPLVKQLNIYLIKFAMSFHTWKK